MNWWSILKVQQTLDVGTSPSKPVSEGAGITGLQQRAARSQEFQPAGDLTQPQQQTLNVNPTYNPIKPNVQQQQQQQQTQTGASDSDSAEDDSDVGMIRENVNRAKQNLSQLPRGPKAAQLTQILTDLSAAAIDPVNQKNIAITAKKKLQEAFPQIS